MTQGMDVGLFGDATGSEGHAESPLQGGAAHRLGGRTRPQTAVTFGRKEPERMAMRFPLLAQEQQRAFGQRHVAVLVALAGADVQKHALGINVGNLETQAFTQSQATGVDRGQAHSLVQGGDGREDAALGFAGKRDAIEQGMGNNAGG